jgi:hypothetical protein
MQQELMIFKCITLEERFLFSYSREKENQIWVLDKLGHPLPNMPLRGKGKVVISDLKPRWKIQFDCLRHLWFVILL